MKLSTFNQIDLESIQPRATTAFLAASGYIRTMPREIVFASKAHQGLGFKHLYDIQGADGIKVFMQEINNKGTNTYRLLRINLDVLQLESGIGQPIFENTCCLDYVDWGWIHHLRDFLHHIQGQIIGVTQKPPTSQANDRYIMDAPALQQMSRQGQSKIQRCHLYLQIATLSDIACI